MLRRPPTTVLLPSATVNSNAAHVRDFRQADECLLHIFPGTILELVEGNRGFQGKISGACSSQGAEMGAATKSFSDLVGISPHVEPFAAKNTKIDLGQTGS